MIYFTNKSHLLEEPVFKILGAKPQLRKKLLKIKKN